MAEGDELPVGQLADARALVRRQQPGQAVAHFDADDAVLGGERELARDLWGDSVLGKQAEDAAQVARQLGPEPAWAQTTSGPQVEERRRRWGWTDQLFETELRALPA